MFILLLEMVVAFCSVVSKRLFLYGFIILALNYISADEFHKGPCFRNVGCLNCEPPFENLKFIERSSADHFEGL